MCQVTLAFGARPDTTIDLWDSLYLSVRKLAGTMGFSTRPPVSDLAVIGFTKDSLRLVWTAPGLDSDRPEATEYDIRYDDEPIIEVNWSSVRRVEGLRDPQTEGTLEVLVIPRPANPEPQHFALRSVSRFDRWSELSNVIYEDYNINFADPALESSIRQLIGKPEGTLTSDDFSSIDRLTLQHETLLDLSGIEHCRNLRILTMLDNRIVDIKNVIALNRLEVLNVQANELVDPSPAYKLPKLNRLSCSQNDIRACDIHGGSSELVTLDLSRNRVTKCPVSSLPKLRSLVLSDNRGSEIGQLEDMPSLRDIYLDGNDLEIIEL